MKPTTIHCTPHASLLALLLATTVALAACGGSDGAEPAANLPTARNVDAPVQALADAPGEKSAPAAEAEPAPASFVSER